MAKLAKLLITGILSFGIVSTMIESATANPQYDAFKKTQYLEFQGDKAPDNCSLKQKRLENITYKLCSVNRKPLYIILLPDNAASGVIFSYKKGKLVQVYSAEDFSGSGFRNNRLIVEWNDELQTANTNLASPSYEQEEKRTLAASRKALRLFGINQ